MDMSDATDQAVAHWQRRGTSTGGKIAWMLLLLVLPGIRLVTYVLDRS
jgi:hypothetical protein